MSESATSNIIVVSQLNQSQWHALLPDGGPGTGATNYFDALGYALVVASLEGWAVETIGLDGERVTIARSDREGGDRG